MSRSIDAAVAEHVMGWRWVPSYEPRYYLKPPESAAEYRAEFVFTGDSLPSHAVRSFQRTMPYYTSDPAADYSVLSHVRVAWTLSPLGIPSRRIAFELALRRLWRPRIPRGDEPEFLQYEVGDYSRAALSALGINP